MTFGFNPSIKEPIPDPEQARGLLRRAGLAGGFSVKLHTTPGQAEAAGLVAAQLGRLGVRAEVTPLPAREYFAALSRRDLSLWLNGFGSPSGDASDVLEKAMHSTAGAFGTQNYGGYSNPDVDRAIEESAAQQVVGDRRALLQQILARVMDDLPWIPLYLIQDVYVLDRRLAWEPRQDSFVFAWEVRSR